MRKNLSLDQAPAKLKPKNMPKFTYRSSRDGFAGDQSIHLRSQIDAKKRGIRNWRIRNGRLDLGFILADW